MSTEQPFFEYRIPYLDGRYGWVEWRNIGTCRKEDVPRMVKLDLESQMNGNPSLMRGLNRRDLGADVELELFALRSTNVAHDDHPIAEQACSLVLLAHRRQRHLSCQDLIQGIANLSAEKLRQSDSENHHLLLTAISLLQQALKSLPTGGVVRVYKIGDRVRDFLNSSAVEVLYSEGDA